ncbi:MAG: hypothetical protein RL346_1542 [Verrucomicrobiota bacterium]
MLALLTLVGGVAMAEMPEPALPKVLLIGDSIMGGYFRDTEKNMKGKAQVVRIDGQGGTTENGLAKLGQWLGDTDWDVIHFNWGLHDICYRHPQSKLMGQRDKVNGHISVTLEDYQKNLEELILRLKKTRAKLVFATTTKVPEGEPGRHVGDEVRYNKVAVEIMKKHGVPINDLYSLTAGFTPDLFAKPEDVHFSGKANTALAAQVTQAIQKAQAMDP